MLNKREARKVQLKEKEDNIKGVCVFLFAAFISYRHDWSLFSFFFSFIVFFLLGFIVHPFLEEKLQIRKMVNYDRRRERNLLALITLTPILLATYLIDKYC